MSTPAISPAETSPSRFANAIRQLQQGRNNATGSCTLATGATSTVVKAPNCAPTAAVFLFPATANAAAALATTYVTAGNVGNGQFTVTHANNSQADRSFFYVVLG